jgi:hypothetical protein
MATLSITSLTMALVSVFDLWVLFSFEVFMFSKSFCSGFSVLVSRLSLFFAVREGLLGFCRFYLGRCG